ncbi:Oligosaccharyltransferase subunit Ribophorin II-domain-containing protein [Obelidium mucronatum]|nr:Oligosaccharyltransferase subunit Ribophorin II-domain-containing protein [Obelidium mucronatum]
MAKILTLLLTTLSLVFAVQASFTTKLVVQGRDGGQIASVSVASPKTLAKPVNVGEGEVLALSVSESDEKDNVLWAHFAHSTETDAEASFVFEGKGAGKYQLNLDVIKKNTFIYNKIKQHPGLYKLSVLSKSAPEGVLIGSVNFDIRPLEPVHVLGSTESFAPVKEIYHVFRQAEKMPNALISYAFAAAVVFVPWALLLVLWSGLNVNVSNLSASSSNLFWGSAFLLSLTASCVFFYVYWVQLNLFQLFGYGSVIWSIMGFLGRQALVSRADARLLEEKKAKAAAK